MNELIEIKLTKATLFLYPSELLNNLPPSVLATAIKRGKAIKRSRQAEDRMEKYKEGVKTL